MALILKVEDLAVERKEEQILRDVNLSIEEGEKIAILGCSGTGKTTFLQSLRGVEGFTPSKGNIIYNVKICPKCLHVEALSFKGRCKRCREELDKKEINVWDVPGNIRNALKHRLPIMLQRTPSIFSQKTTLENVMFSLRYIKCPYEEREKRSVAILKNLALSHRLHQTAGILSGGEKQRLALAREIALDPIILFLDEPVEMLDPITAMKIYEYMKSFEFTTIFSTHLLSSVEEVANRSILIKDGSIGMDGKTGDIKSYFESLKKEERSEKKNFGETMIICKEVRKYFPVPIKFYSKKKPFIKVVDRVNMNVKRGEIRGLIGISGSGKTVLSNIISAHQSIKDFSGVCQVKVKGEVIDLHDPRKKDKVRKNVKRVYQEYEFFPEKTIYENLRGVIPEFEEEESREKIYTMLKYFFPERDIPYILNRLPNEVCEGERQKLIICMALLKEPEIALLDEPSGTLDIHTKEEMVRGIRKIRDMKNITFLIVTHDFEFAKEACDYIDFMKEGKIESSCNAKNFCYDLIEGSVK